MEKKKNRQGVGAEIRRFCIKKTTEKKTNQPSPEFPQGWQDPGRSKTGQGAKVPGFGVNLCVFLSRFGGSSHPIPRPDWSVTRAVVAMKEPRVAATASELI